MSENIYDVIIIGGGPTGLGAAWQLTKKKFNNWLLIESSLCPGGLASSVINEQGFTWDIGGHVVHSHYEFFDRVLEELLKDNYIEHVRESYVWMCERFIPYPLQNNIWRLPKTELIKCLDGLKRIYENNQKQNIPSNFHEWLLSTFGSGLCDVF